MVEWGYSSPSIVGRFASRPAGVILHGSRSGRPIGKEAEYRGTRNFAAGGANGLGWNATIGADILASHISPEWWGYSAGEHSRVYLATEFAQSLEGEPITDGQVRAFAHWFTTIARPAWPSLDLRVPGALPMHAELSQGIRDGKSDAFRRGDPRADDLRGRIIAAVYE